jgi:hypothetical protein
MANAAADSSDREPPRAKTVTVALEPEAKGLHQLAPHTTTRSLDGSVLHCYDHLSWPQLEKATTTSVEEKGLPAVENSIVLVDPASKPPTQDGEALRRVEAEFLGSQ